MVTWAEAHHRCLTMKMYSWQMSSGSDAAQSMSSGNTHKNTHETLLHLPEKGPDPELNTSTPGEDVELQELLFVAGGQAAWRSQSGSQLAGFLQTKHSSHRCSSCAPWYQPE